MVHQVFVWLSGHDPKALAHFDRSITGRLALVGSAVLLAVIWNAGNYAIVAYSLSGGDRTGAIAAIFGALVGAGLVLGIDRGAIGLLDVCRVGRLPATLFFAARFSLAALLGSVSSYYVVPLMMPDELAAHALHMRERSDNERVGALNSRFKIDQLRETVSGAENETTDAQRAVNTIPPAIQASIKAGRVCWQNYWGSLRARVRGGMSESVARGHLSRQAARCRATTQAAQNELDAYRRLAQQKVAAAEQSRASANEALGAAQTEVTARLADAYAIERAATSARSSTVLRDLLATDPMFGLKFWSYYAFSILLELLPILTKCLIGRSTPGAQFAADNFLSVSASERRIADEIAAAREGKATRTVNRKVSAVSLRQRVASARYNAEVEKVSSRVRFSTIKERIREDCRRERMLREFMDEGLEGALASVEAQRMVEHLFRSKIEVFIPVEIAKRMMDEFENHARSVEALQQRHPDCAEVFSELWRQASVEVIETLERLRARGRSPAMGMAA